MPIQSNRLLKSSEKLDIKKYVKSAGRTYTISSITILTSDRSIISSQLFIEDEPNVSRRYSSHGVPKNILCRTSRFSVLDVFGTIQFR